MPELDKVVIALVALFAGHVLSRFAEAHKASVNVAAKRKERFYDKQAAALGGCYERLSKCVISIKAIDLPGTDMSLGEASHWNEYYNAIERDLLEFQQYFSANAVYLSKWMVKSLIQFDLQIRLFNLNLTLPLLGHNDAKLADRVRRLSDKSSVMLDEIQDEFRRAMLVDDEEPTLWSRIRRWRPKSWRASATPGPSASRPPHNPAE